MRKRPLSFDSSVDSVNSDRGSQRPKQQGKRAQGSTRNARKHACGDTTNHQSPTPQEVNNGQVQDVIMSVVISDSVVHLSISGPHECDSQHRSSS